MKKVLFSACLLAASFYAQAQTASVQLIHNSPDLAADTVDIWLGSTLLVDDMPFRTATPFLDSIPAGRIINIGIAPSYSVDSSEAFRQFALSLTAAEKYIIVADGIVSSSGYSPSPMLDLSVYAGAQVLTSNSSDLQVLFHHGCTDAGTITVSDLFGSSTSMSYRDFAGYNFFTPQMQIVVTNPSNPLPDTLREPFYNWGWMGTAVTVVFSGFQNPADNSNGAPLGLWATNYAGGNLREWSITSSIQRSAALSSVRIYPNPASEQLNLSFEGKNADASLLLFDALGQLVYERQLGQLDGQQNLQISVADFPAGLYQLTLRSGLEQSSQRLIIQK